MRRPRKTRHKGRYWLRQNPVIELPDTEAAYIAHAESVDLVDTLRQRVDRIKRRIADEKTRLTVAEQDAHFAHNQKRISKSERDARIDAARQQYEAIVGHRRPRTDIPRKAARGLLFDLDYATSSLEDAQQVAGRTVTTLRRSIQRDIVVPWLEEQIRAGKPLTPQRVARDDAGNAVADMRDTVYTALPRDLRAKPHERHVGDARLFILNAYLQDYVDYIPKVAPKAPKAPKAKRTRTATAPPSGLKAIPSLLNARHGHDHWKSVKRFLVQAYHPDKGLNRFVWDKYGVDLGKRTADINRLTEHVSTRTSFDAWRKSTPEKVQRQMRDMLNAYLRPFTLIPPREGKDNLLVPSGYFALSDDEALQELASRGDISTPEEQERYLALLEIADRALSRKRSWLWRTLDSREKASLKSEVVARLLELKDERGAIILERLGYIGPQGQLLPRMEEVGIYRGSLRERPAPVAAIDVLALAEQQALEATRGMEAARKREAVSLDVYRPGFGPQGDEPRVEFMREGTVLLDDMRGWQNLISDFTASRGQVAGDVIKMHLGGTGSREDEVELGSMGMPISALNRRVPGKDQLIEGSALTNWITYHSSGFRPDCPTCKSIASRSSYAATLTPDDVRRIIGAFSRFLRDPEKSGITVAEISSQPTE